MGLCIAITLAVLIRREPDYTTLLRAVDLGDVSEITKVLKDQKIGYKLDDGGSTILVLRDQVHEARVAVAGKGLPHGGGTGFELFDRSGANLAALSEFSEHLNYVRALQGELARTIQEIDGIEKVRVHLSLPEEEVFSERQKQASASVTLRLRPSARMTASNVSAIVSLVSSSVPGLEPDRVAVVNQRGQVLWDERATRRKSTAADDDATERYQRRLEDDLTNMLERVVGEDHSVVRVSATLDLSEKEVRTERYVPPAGGKNVRVRQSVDERYRAETRTASPAPVGPASMAPTSVSPAPASPASPAAKTKTQPASAPGGSNDYGRKNESVQYELDHETSHEVIPPGRVRRLAVAVLVDETALSSVGTGRIETLVATAAGLDRKRGDEVTVQALPFTHAIRPVASSPSPGARQTAAPSSSLTPTGLTTVFGVIGALMLLLLLKTRADERKSGAPKPAADCIDDNGFTQPPEASERAAALIRTWMTAEETHEK